MGRAISNINKPILKDPFRIYLKEWLHYTEQQLKSSNFQAHLMLNSLPPSFICAISYKLKVAIIQCCWISPFPIKNYTVLLIWAFCFTCRIHLCVNYVVASIDDDDNDKKATVRYIVSLTGLNKSATKDAKKKK